MEGRGSVWISWNVKRCIGILWVLLLIGSVNSTCPDADNQTMACDVLPVDGLVCSYVKGSPKGPLIDGPDVPSKVANLNAAPGFAPSSNGQCGTRLNVTWNVSYDGSLQYLRGFFLVMSFFYKGSLTFLNRTFDLSGTNWTKPVSLTLFRHECVVPLSNSWYHIKLYSLPMNDQMHHITTEYLTSSTAPSNNLCDRTGDPNYTFNWTATMWASQNPSNASIEVCFYTAPPSYNFSAYYIYLFPNLSDSTNMYIERKHVTVDLFKTDAVCQRFLNLCSGVYKIWVTPVNEPVGTCHNGKEEASCTATVIQSINMTESVCTASTPLGIAESTPIATPTATPTYPSQGPERVIGLDNAKIAGIVIGISLAVILVAVLAGVFCLRKRRSWPEKPPICGLEANSISKTGPSYSIDDQQIVLIVYSSDNEYHRKVVRNFAAFLHSCCKCDVRFDDWSQVDISQTNALDWLTKQLHQAKHIIFINSLGAFMQQKAWMEGATCSPVKELLLPDMFIPALRQVQSRVYEKPPTKRLQYYHVYFPYTDVKHLLDVSFGQRYKLMKHIEDLFLNIHGMTKYSEIGQTSALQINAHSYMGSVEGQALLTAIDEACASVKRNPNWFSECYTYQAPSMEKEVTLINYSPANGNIHHNNDGQPMTGETSVEGDSYGSIGSNASRRKSSDEGVHIYQDMIPPSSSGSCISDMDRRSGSLDIGFGDTIDSSSTFDPNSPSVLLGFRPPIPDDDETTSIGSHMFFDKLNELNEQYDSGIPFSSFELKPSDRSSC